MPPARRRGASGGIAIMPSASSSRTYDVLAIGRSSIDLYAHEIGCPITEVRIFDAYVGGCPTNVSVGTRKKSTATMFLA